VAKTGVFGDACVDHHTAVIEDRGGTNRQAQLVDLSSVQYKRMVDGKTIATVQITGQACRAQTSTLRKISARRHELAIYRGSERVWEGPILKTSSTSQMFQIDAADILTYMEGTALRQDWRNVANGGATSIKTQRLAAMIAYELANGYSMVTTDGTVVVPAWESLTPAANILPWLDVRHHPTPALATQTTVDTRAFQMTLAQHLYDLTANGGIHFTVIGRRLVIWDAGLNLGRLRAVSEGDFSGDFQVIAEGTGFATIDHVTSTSTTASTLPPAVGHGSVDFSYYGPWERVDPTAAAAGTATTLDQSALNSQAKARVRTLYPLPLKLQTASGATLIPKAGLTMAKLVPGVLVPVVARTNIRDFDQVQRLDSITVTETAASGEKIATTLGAIGIATA
jgi:hypothetical protein